MPLNIYKDNEAKLETAYSLMLKYSKITVRVETTNSWRAVKLDIASALDYFGQDKQCDMLL